MSAVNERPQGHKKRFIVFFLFLCALITIGGIGYYSIKETPRYSLYWFKKAILDHDAESALRYLDIDSIVDNMMKDMSGEEDKDRARQKAQPESPTKNIGRDIIRQNLPAIKEQLREQLESAIVSYNDRTVLDNLSNASVFGLRITMEGDVALVKIWGKNKVAFKMAKSPEGQWKIISLNLKELAVQGSK
jgi:hypothetical protein